MGNVVEVNGLTKFYLKGGRRSQYSLIDNVRRRYRGGDYFKAVDNACFNIREGEIFGLLGPNGAGKTTIIKMLSTLVRPDGGKAFVYGNEVQRSPRKVKADMGLVLARIGIAATTVKNDLENHALLYGVPKKDLDKRVDELLNILGLEDVKDFSTITLSTGYTQRLILAKSLIHKPKIWLLDEPTLGMDPAIHKHFWKNVLRLKREWGLTILLTTHYMAEAERFCNRVGFVYGGKVVTVNSVSRLKSKLSRQYRLVFEIKGGHDFSDSGFKVKNEGDKLTCLVKDFDEVSSFTNYLKKRNLNVLHFEVTKPSLEDVFLYLNEGAKV